VGVCVFDVLLDVEWVFFCFELFVGVEWCVVAGGLLVVLLLVFTGRGGVGGCGC